MMAALPTVQIAAPEVKGGFIRINESDFDPSVHILFRQEAPAPQDPPAVAPPEAPAALPVPASAPDSEDDDADHGADAPSDEAETHGQPESGATYRVEQNGSWWSLYDPTGEKVGHAKRTAQEAAEQAPEGAHVVTVED